MAGQQDMIAYLQRVCGYCLTGSIKEHALFFFYGTGGNGKSVFVSILRAILGAYHKAAGMETFTASRHNQHPTDLAGLRARLVTALETEEGRAWNTVKINAITGGDEISARFMRQDFFSFTPTFKLMIAGNHKPRLKSVNEATRRRFQMLEWGVKIAVPDRELIDKLQLEGPAILRWMLDGCLAWQQEGLNPPASVLATTAKYLEMEDSLGAWIAARCELNPNFTETSAILFESWNHWSEIAREVTGNRKDFCKALEARGIVNCALGHANTAGYRGIKVRDLGDGTPGGLRPDPAIPPDNLFAVKPVLPDDKLGAHWSPQKTLKP